MNNQYVTKLENGAYRVARTRVSLDSVVYAYWRGESPEGIVDSFPTLTLEQVYVVLRAACVLNGRKKQLCG